MKGNTVIISERGEAGSVSWELAEDTEVSDELVVELRSLAAGVRL
jgi:hypothetical protein